MSRIRLDRNKLRLAMLALGAIALLILFAFLIAAITRSVPSSRGA